MPHIIPVVPTVPAAVLLLLHTPVPPDAVASLNGIQDPAQTDVAPVIVPAFGDTFTVTFIVVTNDPHDVLVSV